MKILGCVKIRWMQVIHIWKTIFNSFLNLEVVALEVWIFLICVQSKVISVLDLNNGARFYIQVVDHKMNGTFLTRLET